MRELVSIALAHDMLTNLVAMKQELAESGLPELTWLISGIDQIAKGDLKGGLAHLDRAESDGIRNNPGRGF
ncbi:MAG TPA: hypothetical protein VN372_07955 [Methanospirillum sp.]|nr:hypothetical protein [Methanospirillum sp.]